jgi:hypothetical protein
MITRHWWHHQIPAHKRERGSVASFSLAQSVAMIAKPVPGTGVCVSEQVDALAIEYDHRLGPINP